MQHILSEVPDAVYRQQITRANEMVKNHSWVSLLAWLKDAAEHSPGDITSTTGDEDSSGQRINLLATIANCRPVAGASAAAQHRACVILVVKAFYNQGLINMQVGKNRSTPLLIAAACGNIEVAQILLPYGAGIPLWLLSGLFIRNYFPAGGHPFFRLGLRRGGRGV